MHTSLRLVAVFSTHLVSATHFIFAAFREFGVLWKIWFFFRATLFALLNKNPKTWVHCVLFKCGNVVTQRKETKNDEYNNQFYTHTHTLIERLLRMSGACNSLVNLLSTKRAQRSIKQQIVISTNSRRNEKNLAISLSMPSCFIIRVYDERTIQLDLMPKNAKLANNRRWTS